VTPQAPPISNYGFPDNNVPGAGIRIAPKRGPALAASGSTLNFRIEIKEGIDALAQLLFDIVLRPLDNMKGNAGVAAVLKLHLSFAHFFDFL